MIKEPVLTWHVKMPKEIEYTPADEKYLGTASSLKELEVSLRLWNNRYGMEDAPDLKSFAIRLSFGTLEDSALLKFCSMRMNGIPLNGQTVGGQLLFVPASGVQISGKANNGLTADNAANYKDFVLTIKIPEDARLKENDLKNLFVEVILT